MDTMRGNFDDRSDEIVDLGGYEVEDEVSQEPPPSIGTDERRMQVRAYNHWASLLNNHNFPSIEDLDPLGLPDFGPFSVLLDFSMGIENPSIRYLGDKLAAECGASGPIETLADVPSRSLLSRITDHYMQILANQAPIGFEAEFVNQRESTILYRGILLPFSSDDDTIDFIYGVINWKELADQHTTDELLLQIDQALETAPEARREAAAEIELTNWADGPAELPDADILDLGAADILGEMPEMTPLPAPSFGLVRLDHDLGAEELPLPSLADPADDADLGLADWLSMARELAQAAKGSEDRTRSALYAAIGRAYDFSIAALAAPEEFSELVTDAGLTIQDRAPMTPVVKLVFGADYDKTRLTEYAAALGHAHRIGLTRGSLAGYLNAAPGGLKGIINAERRLRRAESGAPVQVRETPREALARKLRRLEHRALGDVATEGSEFALLVARRLPTGEVVLLGEVSDDIQLLERAARQLVN